MSTRWAVVAEDGKITFHDDYQDADALGEGTEYEIRHYNHIVGVLACQWYSKTGIFTVQVSGVEPSEELVRAVHEMAGKMRVE